MKILVASDDERKINEIKDKGYLRIFDALGSPGRFRHAKYIYIKTFYNRLFAFKAFTKVWYIFSRDYFELRIEIMIILSSDFV